MIMNRRHFLKTAGLAAGAATLFGPGVLLAREPRRPLSALRLAIVHTTDVHSWLEPATTGQYAGLGGAPARAAMIKQLRALHPNLLLIDSGDILMGTTYFTVYQGEPDFRTMSAMGYDCAAVGNHDFDAGIDRLAELTRDYANFPMLAGNYDFSDTPVAGLTKPWIVREFDGLKVGMIGINIQLDGLVPARAFAGTRYTNPMEVIPPMARHLRHEEGCDFLIGVSHASLGGHNNEPGDRHMIREIPELDLILSGHNHQLFDKPERFARPGAAPGHVLQSGWAGTHLGFLQFDIFGRGEREIVQAAPLAVRAAA